MNCKNTFKINICFKEKIILSKQDMSIILKKITTKDRILLTHKCNCKLNCTRKFDLQYKPKFKNRKNLAKIVIKKPKKT